MINSAGTMTCAIDGQQLISIKFRGGFPSNQQMKFSVFYITLLLKRQKMAAKQKSIYARGV
jgi:hypothetical protein